jgi:hypothetical protein
METSDAIIAATSGSPEPQSADINTPDVSVTDIWSESNLQILRNYEKYHSEMAQFFVNLKKDGPGIWDEPKKPKDNYKLLLGKGKGKFKKLVGKDLHNFLKNSCITSSDVKCPKVSEAGPFTSLASMKDYLISGYHGLKKCHSNTLAASIDYGDWLNEAFDLHFYETYHGKQTTSWREYLKQNVGIGDSYARKLRTISDTLGPYKRFRNLGLPVSEVCRHLGAIKCLLATDVEASSYWRAGKERLPTATATATSDANAPN